VAIIKKSAGGEVWGGGTKSHHWQGTEQNINPNNPKVKRLGCSVALARKLEEAAFKRRVLRCLSISKANLSDTQLLIF
jgi:hypothetical protein